MVTTLTPTPRLPFARSQTLQAIALFRLEQADEAADVAEEVAKDTKGDGKALLDTDVLWLCSWILDTCSRGALRLSQSTGSSITGLAS